jgi:predicted lipid-binding transport protein (Tim44 family)
MFMKKFWACLMLSFLVAMTSMSVEAKRLGGSKSMGRQSSTVTQKQTAPAAQPAAPTATPAATPAPAPTAAPAPAQKRFGWGGMLGGLAAGLGLGWLLSHFGLGEAASSFLMGTLLIMMVVMVGLWIFRKISTPTYQTSAGPASGGNGYPRVEPNMPGPTTLQASAPVSGIADFDQDAFLMNAKKYFVRLQEAWDRGDLSQLQEFATQQMFDELKQDLQARSGANRTEVLTLDAELLGVETANDSYLASVRFSGMIREQSDSAAESFVEVWNLTKPVSGSGGWVLAGIQQLV